MYIRSNILTADNVRDAVFHARKEGHDIFIDEEGISSFKPRRFEHGFQFYCEALNGKRARNGRPGRAATWDAHGVMMAYLFKLDPDAEISWYKGVRQFLDVTTSDSESAYSRGEAPWLADAELWDAA